ncbi:MAG TPA: class I SAM-dependent methyltransferase [Nitrospirales bacterium]|nr:class I SAM-dependent methyltransferase [Nitrospirales bacterium]
MVTAVNHPTVAGAPSVGGEGERFVDAAPRNWELFYQHVARYRHARRFVADRIVLDLACGSGYGAALLARTARRVLAADVSRSALQYGAVHHGAANVQRLQSDGCRLALRAASIDVIVSFETIEHVPDMPQLLREFHRVLKPDGLLLVSTPNRPLYGVYNKGRRNPFHCVELEEEEFRSLLGHVFAVEAMAGQRHFARKDIPLIAPFASGPVPTGPDGLVRRAARAALRTWLPQEWRAHHWLDMQIWANKCSIGDVPPAHGVYMIARARKTVGASR